MNTYQQDVAEIVSQASVHFRSEIEPIATALFDPDGKVVFDNGAHYFAEESALIAAVVDCTVNALPGALFQCNSETVTAFAMSLDGQYMFVIVGHQIEDKAIETFLANLHQILPMVPANAN